VLFRTYDDCLRPYAWGHVQHHQSSISGIITMNFLEGAGGYSRADNLKPTLPIARTWSR
jgi:hypothetical protein